MATIVEKLLILLIVEILHDSEYPLWGFVTLAYHFLSFTFFSLSLNIEMCIVIALGVVKNIHFATVASRIISVCFSWNVLTSTLCTFT